MTTTPNNNKFVEKLIKNLDLDLTTNKAAHDAVCQDVLIAHKESVKTKLTARQQNIYRIIMKIPTTKLLTAAAVIIIAFLSGINYWPMIKKHSTNNQQSVEQVNPDVPKYPIHALSHSDESQPDEDDEFQADKDKE